MCITWYPDSDSDSDSDDGYQPGDGEVVAYAYAREGLWGHWPGKCKKRSGTCTFKTKDGAWGEDLWRKGHYISLVRGEPPKGLNYYWATHACTWKFRPASQPSRTHVDGRNMDPAAGDVVDADDGAAAAMAQMMGFSAFGAQDRPQKKRRFNPHADAATEQSSRQTHHRHNHRQAAARGSSTGSNATPLGATRRAAGGVSVPPPPSTNTDEISLDVDVNEPAAAAAAGEENAAPARTSITSLPRPADLPERPGAGTGFVGVPSRGEHGERHQHRGGDGGGPQSRKGEAWYEGYYDPTSNENPWERLEASMGLSPRGSWLSRGHRNEPPAAHT
ncbi:Alpha-1,2-mannosyltransferase alg11 [Purpureocillium lavendulum]|uniref:Alpha-1,2-mannosyltransferase alg11 n=1 Tax=Purpureocillium lavendulum TaxID=1247861 RepID=A0AB34FR96_9HYPO|nr:Alpha-1,2-mannosyltransferase alg11 [Purpureocillium lavendulum]